MSVLANIPLNIVHCNCNAIVHVDSICMSKCSWGSSLTRCSMVGGRLLMGSGKVQKNTAAPLHPTLSRRQFDLSLYLL